MGVDNTNAAAVYGHRLSTVVPGSVTGESVVHELTNMDLAMKLHYVRTVYYFKQSEAIDSLGMEDMKAPMFPWFDLYYPVTGRIRRTEAGRPIVRCNDCGGRIVEAKCAKTLEEWLEAEHSARWKHLVSDKVLGPDLHFSPMVYIQFTKFKCGGIAIGYSWAHVIGDPVSAANCINLWGQLLSGNPTPESLHLHRPQGVTEKPAKQLPASPTPLSVKQVEPVGDCWVITNNWKMATDSIYITENKLKYLQSAKLNKIPDFETLSALFWHCLAKVRVGREPRLVSICRNDHSGKRGGALSSEQKISTVTSDVSPAKVELSDLALLISQQEVDETKLVQDSVEGNTSTPDYVFYGANLTFVDMEGVDLNGLELRGQKPIEVDFGIDGVGSEGAVLVFPGPKRSDVSGKRTVVLILPEDEILQLREVLKSEFDIA